MVSINLAGVHTHTRARTLTYVPYSAIFNGENVNRFDA